MVLYILMFTFLYGRLKDKRKVLYRMTARIRSALTVPNIMAMLGFTESSQGSVRPSVNSDFN
jgi:hypothetical protein